EKDLREEELSKFLERGEMIPLAARLGMALHELTSMLYDIQAVEKKDRMLSFRAQDKVWDVLPGPAFYGGEFEKAFALLHEERKKGDREDYHRLLVDYLGVEADGTVPLNWQKPPRCLRAVMLGYLKSYEVVHGSCLSCNHCVPDERFETDLAIRKSRIVRLSEAIETLLRELEAAGDIFPERKKLSRLFEILEGEKNRSFLDYLLGWTGRLLLEAPDHRAALCIRLEAMSRGLLPLQETAFLDLLRQIGTLAEKKDQLFWLTEIIEKHLFEGDNILDWHWARADFYRRIEKDVEESGALLDCLRSGGEPVRVHKELRRLHHPLGPLPHKGLFRRALYTLASFAEDKSEALGYYRELAPHWSLAQVERELERIGPERIPALLAAWGAHGDIMGFVARGLVSDADSVCFLAEKLPARFFSDHPDLLEKWVKLLLFEGKKYLEAGISLCLLLPAETIPLRRIEEILEEAFPQESSEAPSTALLAKLEKLGGIEALLKGYRIKKMGDIDELLKSEEAETIASLLDDLLSMEQEWLSEDLGLLSSFYRRALQVAEKEWKLGLEELSLLFAPESG
ncbi:MAG TPA: hypothetical protein V6C82_00735, partial [Chroococcales cyanobacterium]